MKSIFMKKPKSMRKYLEKNHGGKWTYIPHGIWICDNRRYGHYIHACNCLEDCNCPVDFYIYDGKKSELVGTFSKNRR